MLLSLGLATPGFVLLCLSMSRHGRQFLRHQPVPDGLRVGLRLGGWFLLATSLLPAMTVPNPGIGLVTWFGLLSLSAAALIAGLNYASGFVILAVPCGSLLAVVTWLVLLLGFGTN